MKKSIQTALKVLVVSLMSQSVVMAKSNATDFAPALEAKKVQDGIEVINLGDYSIHTFYGVSNSHIIETPKSLVLVDMQFLQPQAKALKSYIESLKKPLSKIVLSHAHPDHWFGYTNFSVTPTTTSNVKKHLDDRGAEYIKIIGKKLKGALPENVVSVETDLTLGKQNWGGLDVIVEEYTDQESHASVAIKIPSHGIIIGQDLFYNNAHLVASNLERNKNWVTILNGFIENESKQYHTYLTGHGKNTNADVLTQDIEYLKVLNNIVSSGVTKEEAKIQLIAKFPGKYEKSQGFIDITLRNLYNKNHK